jgi:hypothetical protein
LSFDYGANKSEGLLRGERNADYCGAIAVPGMTPFTGEVTSDGVQMMMSPNISIERPEEVR